MASRSRSRLNGKAAVAVIKERRLSAPRLEVFKDRKGYRFVKIDASRRKSGRPSMLYTLRNNTRRAARASQKALPRDKRVPVVSV